MALVGLFSGVPKRGQGMGWELARLVALLTARDVLGRGVGEYVEYPVPSRRWQVPRA